MREDAPRAAVSTGYESNRHAACIDVSGWAPIQLAAMSAMVGLRFDLRVPAFAKTTPARPYAACLQRCEWADDRGFDAIAISEHHGVADGYMSSPVTLAAAIAACTKQISTKMLDSPAPLPD